MGLIVDCFAGGGGASVGIEQAMGRPVDIAINHDPEAVAMHKINHPFTRHFTEDIWEVDPIKICHGESVDLAWFSPDCTHFSKAKGGKPRSKKIRGLAWVAVKWAVMVSPEVIILENVEEFRGWGPLDDNGHPIESMKGSTFNNFVEEFKLLGYDVDYRELTACDYGAPTKRKRFFMVARCDGRSVQWPEKTNGPGLKPYETAASIINWNIPCPSIFATSNEIKKQYGIRAVRPLADKTIRRIERGFNKFVVEQDPFVINHGMPYLIQYHSETVSGEVRGQRIDEPIMTLDGSNRYGLVTIQISEFHNIETEQCMDDSTNTTPNPVGDFNKIRAYLIKYYGQGTGQSLNEPLDTVVSKDRFGLVAIGEVDYRVCDIGLRMLTPRELFNAQGFPPDYIIDRDGDANHLSKKVQVARCGNAVPPAFSKALVEANIASEKRIMAEERNII